MFTDPGQIPIYWGFRMGDPEGKRRRYCLMCNLFKPERCHHCSACEKCILNMDHHCPWVNNCIGFHNRKYFILLLVYVFLMTFFYWLTTAFFVYLDLAWFLERLRGQQPWRVDGRFPWGQVLARVLREFCFLVVLVLSVLISMFSKFHFKLLFENKTTIENLEKKKRPFHSEWDLGATRNFEQVFGRVCLLWPFPVTCQSGRPVGDGIEWERFQAAASSFSSAGSQQAPAQGGQQASSSALR